MSQVVERLEKLGHALPNIPVPAANYVPWTRAGRTVYVAGMIPNPNGTIIATGKVGREHDVAAAQKIAAACALNAIAVLRDAAQKNGTDLDGLRVVRATVYVNSAPGFTEQHLVANGASDLIGQVFGERGIHARSAVGVTELPLDVPVEVEVIAEFLQDVDGPGRAGA